MIHATAVIHPDAEIAEDVEIGPYVCIEGKVAIGAGCRIQAHAVIAGGVTLGENNVVAYGAVIGAAPQSYSEPATGNGKVIIGGRNIIREYCTIHRGSHPGGVTRIGDGTFLMGGSHVGHDCRVGNNVVIANNCLLGGHVEIGDQAFLGGGCVFHQFVRVGRLAITQGGSRFGKDVPPFLIAAGTSSVSGLNIVGLRRGGIGTGQRREIKEAFKLLYRSGLNVSQALEKAATREWISEAKDFFDFVAAARKRGVCDLKKSHVSDE